jgi:hypothetical protein
MCVWKTKKTLISFNRASAVSLRAALAMVLGVEPFATPVPLLAHHAFSAQFDVNTPIKLTGTVTKVEWTNPHVWFYMDVRDEADNVKNWGLEMGGTNGLLRTGWTRTSLKLGDIVTVEGFRARNGTDTGNATVVILVSTGQRLFAAPGQGR